jgi:Protein of unknown function (DUF2934)
MEHGGDSKVKSKEPKQSKEKKSESKPRKISEKAKGVQAQPVIDPPATPHLLAAEETINGSTNGAAKPSAAAIEGAIETVALAINPPEELIRVRAYELFVDRGGEHGYQLEDWLAAERELKVKHRAP